MLSKVCCAYAAVKLQELLFGVSLQGKCLTKKKKQIQNYLTLKFKIISFPFQMYGGIPALRISSAHENIGAMHPNPTNKLNVAECSVFFCFSDSNCNQSSEIFAYSMHTQAAHKHSPKEK
jgi:hypothetical protein